MKAKERARLKIIEYIGNLDHDFPKRAELATEVCQYKNRKYLYQLFTPAELTQLEREGLEIRRSKYARYSTIVDRSVIKKAAVGDMKAAELFYKRFEGWTEKTKADLNGKLNVNIEDAKRKLLDGLAAIAKRRGAGASDKGPQ